METPDPTFVFLRSVDRWVLAVERGLIEEMEFAWKLVDKLALDERVDLVGEIYRRIPQQLKVALVDFATRVESAGAYTRLIRVGYDKNDDQIRKWEESGRMIAGEVLVVHQRALEQCDE